MREARALGKAVSYTELVVAMVTGMEKGRAQLLHEPLRDYKKLEEEAEVVVRRERGAPDWSPSVIEVAMASLGLGLRCRVMSAAARQLGKQDASLSRGMTGVGTLRR